MNADRTIRWDRGSDGSRVFTNIRESQPSHLGLRAEVEKQSNLENTGSQVIEDLRLMCGLKRSDGFQLDYDRSPHHQVSFEVSD
jgi:hypothetical protein